MTTRFVAIGLVSLALMLGVAWWILAPTLEPPDNGSSTLPVTQTTLPLRLVDSTDEAGLSRQSLAPMKRLLAETLAGGCVLFDADGDGDVDILLTHGDTWQRAEVGGSSTLALYLGDGLGPFEEATAGSGFEAPLRALSAAAADFDGDGIMDVFVSAVGPNRLYRGLGGGRFADVTTTANVGGHPSDWSTGCAWLDYDGDADLDLFVGHLSRSATDDPRSAQGQSLRASRLPVTHPTLFANQGDGSFIDVSAVAGVEANDSITGEAGTRVLGITVCDLDGNACPDILIACYGSEDRYLLNQADGTFRDVAGAMGLGFDALGNPMRSTGVAVAQTRAGTAICVTRVESGAAALHMRIGGAPYRELGSALADQSARDRSYYGVGWPDLDLDGTSDLVLLGGTAPGLSPPKLAEGRIEIGLGAPGGTPPALGALLDAMPVSAPADLRCVAQADMDGDGDLDLLLTSAYSAPILLRSQAPAGRHWLRVRLRGRAPNTSALGARLELQVGDDIQHRYVNGTSGYLSQSELTQTFGLGQATTADRLTIHWPENESTTLEDLAGNQLHVIRAPD